MVETAPQTNATGAHAAPNKPMLTLLRPAPDMAAGLKDAANVSSSTKVAETLTLSLRIGTARSTSVSGKSTASTGDSATVVASLAMLTATLTVPSKSINGVATTGVSGQPAVPADAAVVDSRKRKESSLKPQRPQMSLRNHSLNEHNIALLSSSY